MAIRITQQWTKRDKILFPDVASTTQYNESGIRDQHFTESDYMRLYSSLLRPAGGSKLGMEIIGIRTAGY
jgi:hypothetical protein